MARGFDLPSIACATVISIAALSACGTDPAPSNQNNFTTGGVGGGFVPTGGVGGVGVPTGGVGGAGGAGGMVLPPPAGMGGAAGMVVPPTGGMGGAGGAGGTGGMMEEEGLAMDECGLDTGWNGDQLCILPPPPDQGFQIHIGPSNYENPEPEFVMEPEEELTEMFSAVSGNTTAKFYYWRQYRMRPGSHHLIVSGGGGGGGIPGLGRRLGGSQNAAKDNPYRGEIAPENAGVGMEMPASSPLSMQLHYMNYTEGPIIKEVWVNFWYRDASEVTEAASEVFSMSPMNIAPGQHVVIEGTCPVMGNGRFLTLYGHVHANNNRFSAWRVRNGQRTLLYESFDWEHPLVLEYSSLITNTPSAAATKTPGGFSGVVDIMTGDDIYFECDITNMTQSTFRGANEAKDDEMCILVGDTVGATVSGLFGCNYVDNVQ